MTKILRPVFFIYSFSVNPFDGSNYLKMSVRCSSPYRRSRNNRYKNLKRSTEGWVRVNGSVPIELPETIRFNSDVAFFARDDNSGAPGNIIQLPRRGKSWFG